MARTTGSGSREVRIGAVLDRLLQSRADGESVAGSALLAAHPDIAQEVCQHLETLGRLCRSDARLDALIAHGMLRQSSDPRYCAELGPYQIIDTCGRGGMGLVLKAFEPALERVVAIKLLQPRVAYDPVALARFQREARAAAVLRHENIVTVHAVGEERGIHFMEMEFIDGPSLADVLRTDGPLPAEMIRPLFAQLLAGLEAAHAAGLIHRDIKPANLLLDSGRRSAVGSQQPPRTPDHGPLATDHRLKIADFGLVRVLSAQTRLTQAESSFGTPEYMSPEQARGDRDIDHRTDLYSAGVVLYEMLTGRAPFRADAPAAVLRAVLHDAPPNPRSLDPKIDRRLTALALRLMSKRSTDRFSSAAEAMQALHSDQCPSLPERQRRRRVWLAIPPLIIAAVFGAWVLRHRETLPEISEVCGVGNCLEVRRGDGAGWTVFHRFPPSVTAVRAALARPGDGQAPVVLAALHPALEGRYLAAFKDCGDRLWDLGRVSKWEWPDARRSTEWNGDQVLAADLDGVPGDESIVVVVDAGEYPTALFIVAPRSGQVLGAMWHFGNMASGGEGKPLVFVVPDFFSAGHAAVAFCGFNNKLDGFHVPQLDDPKPLTAWDKVPIVMIVDPREMIAQGECVGPPATARVPLTSARLHAYAFLDVSSTPRAAYSAPGVASRPVPDPSEVTCGDLTFRLIAGSTARADGPHFEFAVQCSDGVRGATLTLDRDLNLCQARPLHDEPAVDALAKWKPFWRVISRNSPADDP